MQAYVFAMQVLEIVFDRLVLQHNATPANPVPHHANGFIDLPVDALLPGGPFQQVWEDAHELAYGPVEKYLTHMLVRHWSCNPSVSSGPHMAKIQQ